MEITSRGLWTMIHGMGFGALFLLACSAAIYQLWSICRSNGTSDDHTDAVLKWYLLAMALLAWLSVLSGTYIVYPWYRAVAPAGTHDLTMYPQLLLKSSPTTIGWHTLGMEWKEHVAWLSPIAMTMAAATFFHYGRDLKNQRYLRSAVLWFTIVAFASAAVAGTWGAMINKYAPTVGGHVYSFSQAEAK